MTFLELATEIDRAKSELDVRKAALHDATTKMEAANEACLTQQQKLTDLMREMQEALGFSKPPMADTNMKDLAMQGQAVRGSFKK